MKNFSLLVTLLLAASPSFASYHHHHHRLHHHRGLSKKTLHLLEAMPHHSFLEMGVPLHNSASLQPTASPVEDQGQCGSCWDFGMTGCLRDTYLAQSLPDPGRLSFMYLLNCARDMDGCGGGTLEASHWMINGQGPPLWSFQPYTGVQGKCKKGPVAASAASVTMLGTSRGPSDKDIIYSLDVLHKPLVTVIAASDAIEDYDDGIYDACDSQQLNHVVMINSYDCQGPCVFDTQGNLPAGGPAYFGVKNSWGASYGEAGYIRVRVRGKDGARCNGIGAQALYYNLGSKTLPAPPVVKNSVPWYCALTFGLLCKK